MQKLGNLEKWRGLAVSEQIRLPRNRRRKIRLDVYAELPTRLTLYNGDGEELGYIATVDGLDGVEFIYDAPCSIVADAPIRFYHNDDESTVVPIVGEALTKIIERAPRNLEFEAMQAKVMANMERRYRSQAAEFEAAIETQSRLIRDLSSVVATKKAEKNAEAGDDGGSEAADGKGGEKTAKSAKAGGNDKSGKNPPAAAEQEAGDAD